MDFYIKNVILKTGLFEDDEGGLFYLKRNNYDATNELSDLVTLISSEYLHAIERWRDSPDEGNNDEYMKGYQNACNDILEELKSRFK